MGQGAMLDVWERAEAATPSARALELLRGVAGGADPASLGLGARDAALLRLRSALFGPVLPCVADCPCCAQRIEAEIAVDALEALMPPPDSPPADGVLKHGGYCVHWRGLSASDAPALETLGEPERIAAAILRRCVLHASRAGEPVPFDVLPAPVLDTAARAIADADPFAQLQVNLTCPRCSTDWQELLDASDFFWREFDVWARRTMLEVHQLAQAYGWNERDCLAVPPGRRRVYLELVAS